MTRAKQQRLVFDKARTLDKDDRPRLSTSMAGRIDTVKWEIRGPLLADSGNFPPSLSIWFDTPSGDVCLQFSRLDELDQLMGAFECMHRELKEECCAWRDRRVAAQAPSR